MLLGVQVAPAPLDAKQSPWNPSVYLGIDADGTINIAVLNKKGSAPGIDTGKEFYGVMHFGMWVDDLAQAEEQVQAAGATHFQGRAPNTPNSFYEVKYRDQDGIVFDITASGWRGAVKNVKPAD